MCVCVYAAIGIRSCHTHVCSGRSTLDTNCEDEFDKVAMKANPAYGAFAAEGKTLTASYMHAHAYIMLHCR